MINYTLMQLKDRGHQPYGKREYSYAVAHDFSLNDYEEVCEGSIAGLNIEDELEEEFDRLYIYTAMKQDVAVSDIFKLETGEMYYVEPRHFTKLEPSKK